MKRILAVVALLLVAAGANAQNWPKLTALKSIDGKLVPQENKDKWGYADENGKMVIKAVFDEAGEFYQAKADDGTTMDIARVGVGFNYGYITREGVYLIVPRYKSLGEIDRFSTVRAVQPNGFVNLIGIRSEMSKKLKIPVLTSTVLQENLHELESFSDGGYAWAKKDGKWGLLNKGGEWTVMPRFDGKKEFRGNYLVTRDGKTGYLSADGKELIPAKYEALTWDSDASGFLAKAGSQNGFLDEQGNVLIEFGEWTASPAGLLKWGDVAFNRAIPGFIATKDGKRAVLSPEGDVIIGMGSWRVDPLAFLFANSRAHYESVEWREDLGSFVVKKNGFYGRLDADGGDLYPCIFESVPDLGNIGYAQCYLRNDPAIYSQATGKVLTVRDYESNLYQSLSEQEYLADRTLPYWMKSHLVIFSSDIDKDTRYGYYVDPVHYAPFDKLLARGSGAPDTWRTSDGRSLSDYFFFSDMEEEEVAAFRCFWEDGKFVYVSRYSGYDEYYYVTVYDRKSITEQCSYGVRGNYFADMTRGLVADDCKPSGGDITGDFLTFVTADVDLVPVLRYHCATWDGHFYAMLDNNCLVKEYRMPLTVIEENKTYPIFIYSTGEDGPSIKYSIKVLEANDRGIARYEILGADYTFDEAHNADIIGEPRTFAYGYIGLGTDFFTEPVFGPDGSLSAVNAAASQDPFVQVSSCRN